MWLIDTLKFENRWIPKSTDFRIWWIWARVPALLFINWMPLENKVSGPPFSYLENEYNNISSLGGWDSCNIRYVKAPRTVPITQRCLGISVPFLSSYPSFTLLLQVSSPIRIPESKHHTWPLVSLCAESK